jgi:hypothetical protein
VTKRLVLTAAAVLAAAFILVVLSLPERSIEMPQPSGAQATAAGAYHIHTNRSDGSGSPEDVAAAAARAGLQFVILTDHGDGTRAPDPPQYRSGVLVIDAVELSTSGGHYIAIGLGQAPYPLRGDPRDVIEDVRRLGGFGVVAHPDSSRPSLRWHDWDAPFDAIEWLNLDTEWRDEGTLQLARALLQYPFRRTETLGALLDRPEATLARWDALTQRRPVVALAAADAHARAGWMDEDADGYRGAGLLEIPSYEAAFRTFAMRVSVDRPLTPPADAAGAAAQLIGALRSGRVSTAIDAIASPAMLEFSAASGGRMAHQGTSIEAGESLSLVARSNGAAGGVIVLRKDGRILTQNPLPELRFESRADYGTYRIEIYLSRAPGQPPVPWIVSNPIYVRPPGWGAASEATQPVTTEGRGIQGGPWHVEKDAGSSGQVAQADPPAGPAEFTYRLAGGERTGQYAALGISVGNALTDRTRLAFRAQASQPMRISVQARRPRSGDRWQRSIYLDTSLRDIFIPLAELNPVGTTTAAFDPSLVDTVLFVADMTNSLPGTAGTFSISDLRVER